MFEQQRFELYRLNYISAFFNKYIGKYFRGLQQFETTFRCSARPQVLKTLRKT